MVGAKERGFGNNRSVNAKKYQRLSNKYGINSKLLRKRKRKIWKRKG